MQVEDGDGGVVRTGIIRQLLPRLVPDRAVGLGETAYTRLAGLLRLLGVGVIVILSCGFASVVL